MNTTQLECFLEVAQRLNFSKAAEAVRMTQPAVSHQIRSLEEELGVKLFQRTSKRVKLTPAGFQFLGDAATIVKIAKTARARLGDQRTRGAVFLSLGCQSQHELNLLPPMLARLLAEVPLLRPALRVIPAQALDNLLESDSIHALFSFHSEQRRAAGQYLELCRCPAVCLASPAHPLSASAVLTLDQLTGPAVLCGRPGGGFPFGMQSRISAGRPASALYIGDGYESSVALVKAGLGFTLLPYLPTMEEPGLICIPVRGIEPVSFGAYFKPEAKNPVLRRFLEIAGEELQRGQEAFARSHPIAPEA